MPEEKKRPEEAAPSAPTQERPTLSPEFYAKLLHLPTCKTEGYCNNCGRCEH